MRRLAAVVFTVLFLAGPLISRAQTSSPVWFTLNASEGQVVTATAPITMRFGQLASTCAIQEGPICNGGPGSPSPEAWTDPLTFSPAAGASTVSIVIGAAAFNGVDPLPGVYKTVQVQEQATAQNITVNGQPVTVPALPLSTTVWFTLNASDGQVVTATAPITMRYGQLASTCAIEESPICDGGAGSPSPEAWTNPVTFSPAAGASSVSIVIGVAAFNGVDPLPGVYKTVQVQEQATAQNITVNGQPVTVPALSSSSSPGWLTLSASDGQVVTATAPITMRYGQLASTCAIQESPICDGGAGSPSPEAWTNPVTFSPAAGASSVSIVIGVAAFNGVDPLPGVYKTVQVQEESSAQNITVNGQPVTVPALGTSICQLTASPTSITFPNTTLGYNYSSVAGITNNCSSTATVTSVYLFGPYTASGFTTPFSLSPGQTLTYTTVFTPTTTGTATGSITFSNASTGQSVSVSFAGSGVASALGQLSSNPTSITFSSVTVNNSQYQSTTITNTGASSVTVSGVSVTGTGFSLGSTTVPFTLTPNQSMPLTVIFSPTATGSAAGTLTVTGNAQNGTLAIPLSGTGTTHSVTLSWSDSDPTIAGFNVYRSNVSGGPYTEINGALTTTSSYVDQTVAAGATYFYTVTAVSTGGAESGYSNEITAVIPSP